MPFDHPLPPLPDQPEGVAWPTQAWPEGSPAPGTDTSPVKLYTVEMFVCKCMESGQRL